MAFANQYLAIALVQRASRSGGSFISAPTSELPEFATNACGMQIHPEHAKVLLEILTECGIASVNNDQLAGDFFRIEKNGINKFIERARKHLTEYVQDHSDDDLDYGSYQLSDRAKLYEKLLSKYPKFQEYLDFGDRWLDRALENIAKLNMEDFAAEDDAKTLISKKDQALESPNWMKLPDSFQLSQAKREELVNFLGQAELSLDALKMPNAEKAMARAYLVAAKTLADAPEPPVDIIWELVNRANQISGIAALLISIFGLFI